MNRIHENCCIFSWRNDTNTANKNVCSIFIDQRTKKKYLLGFFFDFSKDFLIEIDAAVEAQIYNLFGRDLQNVRGKYGYITAEEHQRRGIIMALSDLILANTMEFLFIDKKVASFGYRDSAGFFIPQQTDVFLQALECRRVLRRNIDPKLFDDCKLYLISP